MSVSATGRSVDLVVPFGQVVVQIELAQVFAVHAVRQTGGVEVPGHQVGDRRALPHQVAVDHLRPHEILGIEQRERARHLLAVEIAPRPHLVLQERDLALVDEQGQFAGFGEVQLRGQQRQAVEPLVAVARQRRRGDAEQRSAQAVAERVDLAPRQHRRHRVQRREHAVAQVVVQAQVAVLGPRVLPRQHEHRVPLVDQVLDERVRGRQVEDVVLHDPRRHDQHRLGIDAGRRAARTGSVR